MGQIYLDNNATTRPSGAVCRAVEAAMTGLWANPSSVHRAGQEARHAVELARKDLAALVGVAPKELILTSGGTESIDLAIRGVLGAASLRTPAGPTAKPNVVTSRIEHAAVRDLVGRLESRGSIEVRWLPLDRQGVVDARALPNLLDPATALVSVMWANNETGVIQPVHSIGEVCRARGVPFHCDAVQWVGKMGSTGVGTPEHAAAPARASSGPPSLPCDLLSFSAHKFHGPKGVGGLWVRRGLALEPQILGSQEMDRRGGTENVGGIIGAGVAAREAREWLADPAQQARLATLRDRFEDGLLRRVPDAVVNGAGCPRVWNTTNVGFPSLEAEALLLLLSERGLCASAGAACSSGSLEPSPVLLAMGVPDALAHGSLRFSLSRETTEPEIDEAIGIIAAAVAQLRRSSSASL
ncbi:MAG: cysteine desulfurase [Phycisphaerales bacterium]|nr:cysteine desulfurase [Phycisphaerales bacterium]